MAEQKASNVFWHDGEVSREDRNALLKQRGATLWFTGLSGSGKSTVAVELEKQLRIRSKLAYRLDGDNVRLGINRNLGFSADDRKENIRRVGEISKLMADAGLIVLNSFISPYVEDRNSVRELHDKGDLAFLEIFVDCHLDEAEKRDPKGLYKKARAGEIRNFTGIDDPYEAPANPDIHLRSDKMELREEVELIVAELERRGII